MCRKSLSWLIIRSMSLVASVAFITVIVSLVVYSIAWYWLHPDLPEVEHLSPLDFVILFCMFAFSLAMAALIGWKLAQRFIDPIHAMGEAAKAIAKGEFETRIRTSPTNPGDMGEIDDLVDNFNKMAELLERAQNDLRYQNSSIAHELRTPLTILKGRIQGLADGVFASTPEVYTGLLAHVDSLTRIVDDLRTLALFNAGQLELKVEKFDLAPELEKLTTSLLRELAGANVRLQLDLVSIELVADKMRIRQIILALIDNVCRYAAGSTLHISTFKERDAAVISVCDNGPGLPEYEVRQVFERFWRADDSRSRSSGGSGLGLSVVKAIAQSHNGDVSAARNEAGGLTFRIVLPLAGTK